MKELNFRQMEFVEGGSKIPWGLALIFQVNRTLFVKNF